MSIANRKPTSQIAHTGQCKQTRVRPAANTNQMVAEGGESHMGNVITAMVRMDPQNARWLRDHCHFERQRKISQSNIDRLAAEMKAGRFIPGTQIYICLLPDGTQVVINGNHTLEAVYASGTTQVMTVTKVMVTDLDAAGRLYAVFDIHKARSWLDSLRGAGMEHTVDSASKVLAAISIIENRFGQHGQASASSRIERFERLEEYKESAEILAKAINGAPVHNTKLVKRAAVMAVALETIRYQPFSGAEFWRNFAYDDGLLSGSPEKALLNWLRNAGTGSTIRKETARAAALAWNASFKGLSLQICKPNQMGQFILLGTPWAKGTKLPSDSE